MLKSTRGPPRGKFHHIYNNRSYRAAGIGEGQVVDIDNSAFGVDIRGGGVGSSVHCIIAIYINIDIVMNEII